MGEEERESNLSPSCALIAVASCNPSLRDLNFDWRGMQGGLILSPRSIHVKAQFGGVTIGKDLLVKRFGQSHINTASEGKGSEKASTPTRRNIVCYL